MGIGRSQGELKRAKERDAKSYSAGDRRWRRRPYVRLIAAEGMSLI